MPLIDKDPHRAALCKRDHAWLRGSWKIALHSTVSFAGHTQRRSKSGLFSFTSVPVTRVKRQKKSFSIGVNRIARRFHHDPTVARNDLKAKEKTFIVIDREPLLLDENSDVLHRPRRERRDLAEAHLFMFLRGSIWYGACLYRSSHGPRDTNPL
jgi:hypothetical protein